MTAKVQQNVIPRRRLASGVKIRQTGRGTWQTKQTKVWQRGSVTQSTITLSFAVIVLISITALGLFYLQQVFGTASQGTGVQELEQELVELRQRQKELELQGAELRSIQSVEERIHDLNLVAADDVAYLAPTTEHVAFKP